MQAGDPDFGDGDVDPFRNSVDMGNGMEIALKLKPGEGLSAEEQKAIDEAQQKIEMDEKVRG